MTQARHPDTALARFTDKLRRQGVPWLWRRLWREWVNPTTPPGRFVHAVRRRARALAAVPWRATQRRLIALPADSPDTLYALYDLAVAPITFDFLWFLAGADLARRQGGLAKVHVVVVPSPTQGACAEDEAYEAVVDTAARQWRVHNILVPACSLLPSATGLTVAGSRAHAAYIRSAMAYHVYPAIYEPAMPTYHHPSECLRAAKEQGAEIAVLRAPEGALRAVDRWLTTHAGGRRPVVITLRHYGYMPARNSNLAAWVAFARGLDSSVYAPIFVPDLDQTLDSQPGELASFPVCAEACWNLGLRMALYERAYLNLGVNSGPMGLCWLNQRTRYISFKMLTAGVPQASETFNRWLGFEIGQSLPFATPFQRWLWHEGDDLAVIKREFAAMVARIEAGAGVLDSGEQIDYRAAR